MAKTLRDRMIEGEAPPNPQDLGMRAAGPGRENWRCPSCARWVSDGAMIDVRDIDLKGITAHDYVCDSCVTEGIRTKAAVAAGKRVYGRSSISFSKAAWVDKNQARDGDPDPDPGGN